MAGDKADSSLRLVMDREVFQRLARWDRSVPHSGVSEAIAGGRQVVAVDNTIHIDVEPTFGTPLSDLSGEPTSDYTSALYAKFDPPESSVDRLVLLGFAAKDLIAELDRDFPVVPGGPNGMSINSKDGAEVLKALGSLEDLRAKCSRLFGWLSQFNR